MKDRLKEIRKSNPERFGKTQSDFADFLGLSLSNIASYEAGRRLPAAATVKLICEKCGVNEKWLRTGEGDMFTPANEEQEAAQIAAEVINTTDKVKLKLMKQAVSLIASLSEDQIRMVRDWAKELLDTIDEE